MEQSKINFFVSANAENFSTDDLQVVIQTLEKMDDSQFYVVHGISYQKPMIILIIAIVLGWERLFLGDITWGILKILTGYGCGIWWLIDLFSAKERTYKYNFNRFMEAAHR